MSKPTKVIDLEIGKDGTYEPKQTKNKSSVSISKVKEPKAKQYHLNHTGADEFLAGVDVGLDFVDAVRVRALRIMGMRD